MVKLLAFSGSLRKNSYNQAIAVCAAQGAKAAGAEVKVVHLADYVAPLFSEDLEALSGMPEAARRFKTLLTEHDGFIIANPEYNSAFSAALKNAIDWASRMDEGEAPLAPFKGKSAVLMAASPGALGGVRGLVSLRMLLGNLGMLVHPTQQAIAKVHTLVDEQGVVNDEKTITKLHKLGAIATEYTAQLSK
ncbi:MAG: NAD(P)H-dependent oxidoreductase [Glaciecola sp.]|nr:NAD(P)H-dependent oxidoreductase [Glaciecola sp.]MDG1815085.1 NAD(P)H-dependent oxidoreductase [Glaciecola sp.]MDG2098549.1 NAD(P)H-dependent oxidoreductase [Glaciecola sp.]